MSNAIYFGLFLKNKCKNIDSSLGNHVVYDSATKKPIILHDKLVSYLLQIDYFWHHFVFWNKGICSF